MLPLTDSSTAAYGEYATRMLDFRQMDFEYALWLMANLCFSPRTAFRSTLYHSRTKHQWARDDPAVVVVLIYSILVASIAWSCAFAWRTPLQVIGLFAYAACIDFLLLGMVLATISWWFANAYLHEQAHAADALDGSAYARLAPRAAVAAWRPPPHATTRNGGEAVEWLYAFDIHCNAFVPIYFLLYALQYVLLPLLLRPGVTACLLSNALYACAFSAYYYLTFLGYSEMPCLQKCEVFVYPIALVVLTAFFALLAGINCTSLATYMYFGTVST